LVPMVERSLFANLDNRGVLVVDRPIGIMVFGWFCSRGQRNGCGTDDHHDAALAGQHFYRVERERGLRASEEVARIARVGEVAAEICP